MAPTLPSGLLDKIRALLAKAESTPFDAEAEAFTAKAQALMARYRIDRALLEAAPGAHTDEPIGRRFTVDQPYANAKVMLLAQIAHANGCRCIWSSDGRVATVFGYADELEGVDELFTSLLVQATAALRRAGPKRDELGRSRTKRFRRAFLLAFAHRIGERLRTMTDETIEAASEETGTALVPLLAARIDRVEAAASAAFPIVVPARLVATDADGWRTGRAFGDLADLTTQPLLQRRSA